MVKFNDTVWGFAVELLKIAMEVISCDNLYMRGEAQSIRKASIAIGVRFLSIDSTSCASRNTDCIECRHKKKKIINQLGGFPRQMRETHTKIHITRQRHVEWIQLRLFQIVLWNVNTMRFYHFYSTVWYPIQSCHIEQNMPQNWSDDRWVI